VEGGNDEDETGERWTRGGHPLFAPDLGGVRRGWRWGYLGPFPPHGSEGVALVGTGGTRLYSRSPGG
jgi:hypothetical protein